MATVFMGGGVSTWGWTICYWKGLKALYLGFIHWIRGTGSGNGRIV